MALTILFYLAVLISYSECQVHQFLDSPCGDWQAFKNEKCVKYVSNSGLQTKEDAEIVCKAFGEEFHTEDAPRLVTVKTEEKQEFLQKWLFQGLEVLDNVWLGLDLGNNGIFQWNDGTELFFSNWVEEDGVEPMADRNCVHMESAEGAYEVGMWVRDNCRKRNAVVCERNQPWSVETLQNMLLSLKLEVEKNKKEFVQELNAAKQETANLKRDPVPVGFIYAQLPDQSPPTSLWPGTNWTDVSTKYAGLFFRVDGGKAAPFGQVQQANWTGMEVKYNSGTDHTTPISIPHDGSWSKKIYNGGGSGSDYYLQFRLLDGEVRPRNQAMRIWQKI